MKQQLIHFIEWQVENNIENLSLNNEEMVDKYLKEFPATDNLEPIRVAVKRTEGYKQSVKDENQKQRNSGTRPDSVFDEAQEREINSEFFKDVKALAEGEGV